MRYDNRTKRHYAPARKSGVIAKKPKEQMYEITWDYNGFKQKKFLNKEQLEEQLYFLKLAKRKKINWKKV